MAKSFSKSFGINQYEVKPQQQVQSSNQSRADSEANRSLDRAKEEFLNAMKVIKQKESKREENIQDIPITEEDLELEESIKSEH